MLKGENDEGIREKKKKLKKKRRSPSRTDAAADFSNEYPSQNEIKTSSAAIGKKKRRTETDSSVVKKKKQKEKRKVHCESENEVSETASKEKKKKLEKYELLEATDTESYSYKITKSDAENRTDDSVESPSQKSEKGCRKNKKSKKKIKSNSSNISDSSSDNSKISSRNERAIQYLDTWKNNRSDWKFEKLTQFWLLKNMFNKTTVPEKSFKILLEYLIDLKGGTRNFAIEACEGFINKMEKSSSTEKDECLELAYERARSVLQHLQ